MNLTSPAEPVRWGVLGAANIALKYVIPAMQQNATCEVVALASRDLGKAQSAAQLLRIPRAYGSYAALIDDPDIEAIYNPLPNHLHVPWTIRALERGKHVLCEKPLALTAAEAETLLEVRNRTGLQVAEAFMVRTHPQWLKTRALVESGEIGGLRLVTGHFSYFRRNPNDVRSHPEWGGGALLDVGCYPITMARWLFNDEPTDVVGQLEFDPDMKIDRLGSAMLRFPAGQASISFGGQVALSQRMQIFGTKGHITLLEPFTPSPERSTTITIDDARDTVGGGAREISFAPVNQYSLQAQRFSEAIRARGAVAVTLEDSVNNMRVIDALFRSAASKQWVTPALSNSQGTAPGV